uniref:Leucine-rich repeat-containing N-terminal plant-type domain-containing protein n=1 Tax=Leptocylindrus danicus TaxID=163516 RepID=A0A7S2NXY9_9STRA
MAVNPCPPTFGNDYCALFELFEATNGCDWDNTSGWLSSTDVCDFAGVTCSDVSGSDEVTELNLDSNNLVGSISTTLYLLPQLTVLDLSDNELAGSIPTQLGLLRSLVTLDISKNAYDNPSNGDGIVPEEVCELRDDALTMFAADCNAAEVELVDCNVAANCCTDCNNYLPSDTPSLAPVVPTDFPTAPPSGVITTPAPTAVASDTPSMSPSCDSTLDYDCTISANTTECTALVDFYENMGGCAWTQGVATGGRRLTQMGNTGTRPWGTDEDCSIRDRGAPDICCWFGVTCEYVDPSIGFVVTKVELVGNNLCGEFQDSIAYLSFLKIFELSYNKIRGGIIGAMATMEYLDVFMVDNNELTGSAEIMCNKDGNPLSFFSADCDDFAEVTACSCCFCTIQLAPSESPTVTASDAPSAGPSSSSAPTVTASSAPSATPSDTPSLVPSSAPVTDAPTGTPSLVPSVTASDTPSLVPSTGPSNPVPSDSPTVTATDTPSNTPSVCQDYPNYECESTDSTIFYGFDVDCTNVAEFPYLCYISGCAFGDLTPAEACCGCK